MICPYCSNKETRVTDKRNSKNSIRRRRECKKCKKRFTTHEEVELELYVIKKNKSRQKFSRDKLKVGIKKAFEKLAVSTEKIEKIIEDVEAKIHRTAKKKEIKSTKIGQIIIDKLKKNNKIAYIRFASVYREFQDISEFKKELKNLK